MTLVDVISLFDKTRPNSFDYETKKQWVLSVEDEIRQFVSLHSKNKTDTDFYNQENPTLYLDKADSDIYVFYLVSMSDLTNAEYKLYNISSTYFNSVFRDWKRKFRSSNRPEVNPEIKI